MVAMLFSSSAYSGPLCAGIYLTMHLMMTFPATREHCFSSALLREVILSTLSVLMKPRNTLWTDRGVQKWCCSRGGKWAELWSAVLVYKDCTLFLTIFFLVHSGVW